MVAYGGVGDAVAAYEGVLDLGARTHSEPREVGGGVIVAAVKDPRGNVCGIIENPHFKYGG